MSENLTLQEARRVLKVNMDGWISSPLVKVDEILVAANNMALKSLDAWEEIKKEIRRQIDSISNMTDKWYSGQLIAFTYMSGLIDKYLKEFKSTPEDICEHCKYHFDDSCNLGYMCINNSEFTPKKNATKAVYQIRIPETATNGNIITALYPNANPEEDIQEPHYILFTLNGFCFSVSKEWWNAPYKGGFPNG